MATDDAADMDALHVLPLRVMPFRNDKIGKARLIKNNQLASMLEVFSGDTGSGQLGIDRMAEFFGIKHPLGDPDMQIMFRLGPLPSFDVFSLRLALRDMRLDVNNCSGLRLSERMQRSLVTHMSGFTVPLLRQIYGVDDRQVERFDQLVMLFRDPDAKKAIARLRALSEKLGIPLDHIPKFIEDYGDIFLSLSYYRHCMDRLAPMLESFVRGMADLRKINKIKTNAALMAEIDRVEKTINGLMTFLKRSFQDFEIRSNDLWENLSADKFRAFKDVVEGAQRTVGGILCGLTVKLNAWQQRFPSPNVGGPGMREEFLTSDFKPGLSNIVDLARVQSELVSAG